MWLNSFGSKLSSFYYEKKSFKNIGINLESTEGERIVMPIRFLAHIISALMWFIGLFAYIIKYYQDIDKFFEAATIFIQIFLVAVKIVIFLIKRQEFAQLVKDFDELHLKTQASLTERKICLGENQRAQRVAMLYYIVVWITIAVCILSAFQNSLSIYLKTGEFVTTLPLHALFPFDYNQVFYMLLAYITCFYFLNVVGGISIGVDCLFGSFVYNTVAHFDILILKIQNIAQQLETAQPEQKFYKHLLIMVYYHRCILYMAARFNSIFRQLIFAEVTVNCLQICFLAYQLANVNDMSNFPLMFMAMATVFIQLNIYCFGGQRVQNRCNLICSQFYEIFPWHLLTIKMKRLLLLPLMRMQRLITLSGYFFTVDCSLLVWIYRTAGSFTALMFAVKRKYEVIK